MTNPPRYYVTVVFESGNALTEDARIWTEAQQVKRKLQRMAEAVSLKIEDTLQDLEHRYTFEADRWDKVYTGPRTLTDPLPEQES